MSVFNEVLDKLYKYDYMVGFTNGKGTIIKWKGSSRTVTTDNPIDLSFAIKSIIEVLLTKTEIKLFDEAIYTEISEAVHTVLKNHEITGETNGERKES